LIGLQITSTTVHDGRFPVVCNGERQHYVGSTGRVRADGMGNGGEWVFGICLVVENGGVQVDIKQNLTGREEMSDGIQICWECVFQDGALNGGFTCCFWPELIGGIAVGSIIDESTILIPSEDEDTTSLDCF